LSVKNRIKVIFFDLGQTLIELSSFKKSMYDALNKHLIQSNLDLNEVMNKWGHETHRLFMEFREKNFIDTMELHALSLKNIFKNYKIQISDKLIYKIVKDVWKNFIENNKVCPDIAYMLKKLK